jgi:ribulose 1,5-bisphosphate carboxylase large subunit-like protein
MGYKAGAMAWRQAFDAVVGGCSLEDAAAGHPELKAALDLWGVMKRPYTPWSHTAPKFRPKFTAR